MSINLDKFWQFVREWSVGRMLVLLSILALLFNSRCDLKELLFRAISLGLLLEVFELSHNKFARNPSHEERKVIKKIQTGENTCEENESDEKFKVHDLSKPMKFGLYMIMFLSVFSMMLVIADFLTELF